MTGRIRQFLNRRKLKKQYAGRGIQISHDVDFNNVKIGDYVNIAHHAQISDAEIGCRTSVGRYTKIQHAKIGSYCSISWDITIGALGHPAHAVSSHAFSYRKQFGICKEDRQLAHQDVVIGNDVWIGCAVVIMPGIHIGNGAVIGAGSIVTHDVAPYEIVAGNPARHLSWRFSEATRNRLADCDWWNLPDQVLKENLDLFDFSADLDRNPEILERLISLTKKAKGRNT